MHRWRDLRVLPPRPQTETPQPPTRARNCQKQHLHGFNGKGGSDSEFKEGAPRNLFEPVTRLPERSAAQRQFSMKRKVDLVLL